MDLKPRLNNIKAFHIVVKDDENRFGITSEAVAIESIAVEFVAIASIASYRRCWRITIETLSAQSSNQIACPLDWMKGYFDQSMNHA